MFNAPKVPVSNHPHTKGAGMVRNKKKVAKVEEGSSWVPNATFDKEPPSLKSNMLFKTVLYATKTKQTSVIEGLHGVGKTKATAAAVRSLGYRPVTFSLAVIMPTDMAQQIPTLRDKMAAGASDEEILADPDIRQRLREQAEKAAWSLKTHLTQTLVHDEPWVLILDEANRVQQMMLPMLMEITQSHRVLGEELHNLKCVILLRNPAGAGYAVVMGDLASESRYPVFPVTANDIPWMEFLSTQYPKQDLKPLKRLINRLDATARRTLAPRMVEHFLQVVTAGLPATLALPIMPSGRTRVENAAGDDITEATLRAMCEAIGEPYREEGTVPLQTCLDKARQNGWNLRLVGPPGIGKTGLMFAMSTPEDELRPVSAACLEPTSLLVTVPADGKVVPILSDKVSFENQGILVLDEYTLAPKHVKPQLLELVQERTLGGEAPPGLKAVWALDNPSRVGGIPLRGRSADEAMVSRFSLNIEVTEADIPWREYLEEKFGEEFVAPFAKWRARLQPDEKVIVNPRVLEMMMSLHANTDEDGKPSPLDVDFAIPYVGGGERAPIRTHGLKAELAGRQVLGLDELIANAKEICALLADPNGDAQAQIDTAHNVVRILETADLKDLEPHEDVLVEYVKVLPSDRRVSLLNTAQAETSREVGQKKITFWSQVFVKTKDDWDS